MSSQSHKPSCGAGSSSNADTVKSRNGEIELTVKFSDQMYKLCLNQDYQDVTFVVEGCYLPAHRVILAARSEYFRALLFGGLSESSQQEIEMKIPLIAFKGAFKFRFYMFKLGCPMFKLGYPLFQLCSSTFTQDACP